MFPDNGIDVATVMQNADTAMFHAKARGRDNYQFFRADMNSRAVRRLSVQGYLSPSGCFLRPGNTDEKEEEC